MNIYGRWLVSENRIPGVIVSSLESSSVVLGDVSFLNQLDAQFTADSCAAPSLPS